MRGRPAREAATSRRPASSRPASAASVTGPPSVGHVVGGVAGAAGHDSLVVFEDQHGRLARHARDAAGDELVGDEVADHDDAAAAKGADQREQARGGRRTAPAIAFRPWGCHSAAMAADHDRARQPPAASPRCRPAGPSGTVLRARPVPGAHQDAACAGVAASCTSRHLSPTTHERARSIRGRRGLLDHAGPGLAAAAARRYVGTAPSGWCGQ